jgi:hypothetical protein
MYHRSSLTVRCILWSGGAVCPSPIHEVDVTPQGLAQHEARRCARTQQRAEQVGAHHGLQGLRGRI